MLKLKLQYFGDLMRRTDPFEKTLMLGKIEGRRQRGCRGWDGWMASLTQWTWVWVNSRSWWWTGRPGVLQSMGSQRVVHYSMTELNWTELSLYIHLLTNMWIESSSLQTLYSMLFPDLDKTFIFTPVLFQENTIFKKWVLIHSPQYVFYFLKINLFLLIGG